MVPVRDKLVKLQLWDTAGQERFRSLTTSYYKMADGVILCYDTSDPVTLDELQDRWLDETHEYGAHCINSGNVLILGTKTDLPQDDVTVARATAFAESLGVSHAVCSARTGKGIDESIEGFVQQISNSKVYATKIKRRRQIGVTVQSQQLQAPLRTGCFAKMMESVSESMSQIRCFSLQVHLELS